MNKTSKTNPRDGVELPEPNYEDFVRKNRSRFKHKDILGMLLNRIIKVDFQSMAKIKAHEKLGRKHYLICTVEHILHQAKTNNWGLCLNNGFVYLYNGESWKSIDQSAIESFLGEAAEKMGVNKFESRHYQFREQLFRQFITSSSFNKQNSNDEEVLINLLNGTFEITPASQKLREFRKEDFIKYQLPFEYNSKAEAPLFLEYLNKVVPEPESQKILAEYIGYLFIKHSTLKLEKALMLYGSGANGKSVFFEVISSLLGNENISNHSLQSLTNENGYYRAKLANKLVNYASEINGKLDASFFKQLVSGEPVEARLPYSEPLTLTNYAKLIFNCNELPKDVEQTHAFFRRFLIIPFNVTIPEEDQDKELAKKITQDELSGVFNWVINGLKRLLQQKNFTASALVNEQAEIYKTQSDTVKLFLEDENVTTSTENSMPLQDLYLGYRQYCLNSGYKPCSKKTVSERLKKTGFIMERKNSGVHVFCIAKSLE